MRSLGLVAVLVVCFGLGHVALATADTIDTDIKHLEHSSNYKTRISSALRLAKSHDRRAIQAFVRVLESPRARRTLRRIAALSLGSMTDTSTPAALREQVTQTLARVARDDRDRKIRRNARRALQQLKDQPAAQPPPLATSKPPKTRAAMRGGVFIHIGTPRDQSRSPARDVPHALHAKLRQTLRSEAPRYRLDWPTGQAPTAAELDDADVRAYHVRTAVLDYQVQKRGREVEVQCTVSLQVNPWSGSDGDERWSEQQAASAQGRGRVMGGASRRQIAASKRECAEAVTAQIATEQVVPFLRRLERSSRK
ncbi:MAG: hypothetical protein Tsb0020_35650 [Haliangiales bacterium]